MPWLLRCSAAVAIVWAVGLVFPDAARCRLTLELVDAPDVDKLTMESSAPLVANAEGKYPVPLPGINKKRRSGERGVGSKYISRKDAEAPRTDGNNAAFDSNLCALATLREILSRRLRTCHALVVAMLRGGGNCLGRWAGLSRRRPLSIDFGAG